jgi:hypothetical protein
MVLVPVRPLVLRIGCSGKKTAVPRHQRDMIESAHMTTLESEAKAVVAWRRQQLSAAGFDTPTAEALARNPRVDLHALLDLVDRGCPPGLAARILAPLEELAEVA